MPREPLPAGLAPADFRPQAPGDGLAGEASHPAVERELVQERVRGGIGRLPRVPHDPHHRGEENEPVQFDPGGRPVQVPGPQHLRPQHLLELLPVQVLERAVVEDAGAVEHPAERRQAGTRLSRPGHDPFRRPRVRDVSALHAHLRSRGAELGDLARGCLVRFAAPVQHDGAGALLGQPARHREAEPAQSAGHQVGAVLPGPGGGRSRRNGEPACRADSLQARREPPVAAPGNLGLPIREQQFLRQPAAGIAVLRVEVEEPRSQGRQFTRHRPPEAPERGSREGARTVLRLCLAAARHEPQSRDGRHPRVLKPLHQGQRAPARPLQRLPQLDRRRLRRVPGRRPQVHHPRQHPCRKPREELPPALPPPAGPAVSRDHPLPAKLQLPGERPGQRPLTRTERPESRLRPHRRRTPRQEHPERLPHGGPGVQHPALPIPRFRRRPAPYLRRSQRVPVTICVVETPPPRQQPEGQIRPAPRLRRLQRHQQSRGREQPAAVRQRLRQITGRMQHVRRDHQIEPVRSEALLHRVPLDVQDPKLQPGPLLRKAFLRLPEEPRRHVRIDVVRPAARQRSQHPLRRAAGPRAHFHNPQPPPSRQTRHRLRHRRRHHPVHRPQPRRLPVERRGARLVPEQKLQRLRPAPQHLRERLSATPQQPELQRTRRTPAERPLEDLLRRPGTVRKPVPGSRRHPPAAPLPRQHSAVLQQSQHPTQNAAVLGHHPQPATERLQLHPLLCPGLPAQLRERPQRVAPRHLLETPAPLGEPREIESLRSEQLAETGNAQGRLFRAPHEVRRNRPLTAGRRGFPPHHFVQQVLHLVRRPQHRRPAGLPQPEAAHPAERLSLRPVELELRPPGPGGLASPVPFSLAGEPGAAPDPRSRRTPKPEPVPAHRQPESAVFFPLLRPVEQRAQRLEPGVQRRPLDAVIPPYRSGGQGRLAQRLGGARPQPGQHRPPDDSPSRQPARAVVQRNRCQLRPQPLAVQPFRRRFLRPRPQPAGSVPHPGLVRRTPAEYLEAAALGAAPLRGPGPHQKLHQPLAVLRGQHQRPLHPQVPHGGRPGRPGALPRQRAERRGGLEGIERDRGHRPAEEPVLAEPAGVVGAQRGLERHLAVREFVAEPEQRVLGAAPPVFPRPDPVPLPLEGIGRQRHAATPLPDKEPAEVQPGSGSVGLGHRLHKARPAAQGRDHRRSGARRRIRPAERRERTEHRARTDLDQQPGPECSERADPLREPHRRTRLPPPVRPVQHVVRPERPARQVAHQHRAGDAAAEPLRSRLQLPEHRVQQRAVEGVTRPQPLRPNPVLPEPRLHERQQALRAADHAVRPVLRRERQPRTRPGTGRPLHECQHPLRRRERRRHRPAGGQRAHERPATGSEAHPVLQPEGPRREGGSDLPRAVPQHRLRNHPDSLPQLGQRRRQRKQRRLRPLRPVDVSAGLVTPEHHREQRRSPLLPEHRLAAVQHRARRRLPLVQLAPHSGPLAPLPGVEERHLARGRPFRLAVPGQEPRQLLPQLPGVSEDEPGAHPEVAPPHARRPRRIREPRRTPLLGRPVPRFVQPLAVPPRQVPEGFSAPGRERQDARLPPGRREVLAGPGWPGDGNRGAGLLPGPPVALQDEVGVRPEEREGAHRRAGWAAGNLRPARGLRRHPHRERVPLDPGVRRFEMQLARDPSVTERQQHLHQSGDARRRLQMADVRLHRTEQQRAIRLPPLSVHRRRRPHLDGISELRPRPVRLQVVHGGRRNPRLAERLPDHRLLRGAVRDREPRARPVLVHRRTEQHSQDPVSVPFGVSQPLQDEHSAALAAHEPVRRRIECLAAAVGRQHPRRLQGFDAARVEQHVHSAGKREVGLAPLQRGHRLVDRHQRRRARRVHGDRRSRPSQREGDPPRPRREAAPAQRVGRALAVEQPLEVAARDAGVHPAAAALQPRVHPRVFERLPAHLQEQPLLGIHQLRLHGSDPEEPRIQPVHFLQVAAPASAAGRGLASGGDGAAARRQRAPERRRTPAPREPAGHSDDRDPPAPPGDSLLMRANPARQFRRELRGGVRRPGRFRQSRPRGPRASRRTARRKGGAEASRSPPCRRSRRPRRRRAPRTGGERV